ncbi:MAG: N-acyl homoserine lactonase family protein [Porticoccaceae bacterium]|jgi:N-acyl homoserine lactone hydrolase|nr:N-acyl homoserine lactonase family protein [Porticoccaceae bacterium]
MKIVEFDDKGRRIESDAESLPSRTTSSALATRPIFTTAAPEVYRKKRKSSGIELHMFQTGTLKTKTKYIKMNHGDDPFEIPVPWFLLKHPQGNVVIDGGNALETAIDKRGHWGSVVDVYEPTMGMADNCVDQLRLVGVSPNDVRFVVQSHLHLDHTGAIGRFPKAQHIVQRIEYDYAYKPHWFSAGAYIRADFDRPGLNWKFLGGDFTDNYDLFGDGVLKMISTPGHSPGHQSFLITLPKSGPILLTIDAAYTVDHWNDKALPGLVTSSTEAAESVAKLRRVAKDTGAMVVTGHDPQDWARFRKAPEDFYD